MKNEILLIFKTFLTDQNIKTSSFMYLCFLLYEFYKFPSVTKISIE